MLAKDIYGIGFATADQIAQKVGIPRDSLDRASAGIDHVLLETTSDGHCALPLGKLKLAAVKLLEVPEETVEHALSQMLTGGSLLLQEIDGEPLIFLPHLRRAEEGIAARIKSLAEAELIYPPIDFEKAVAWCEGGPFDKQEARENQMAKNVQTEMESYEAGLFILGLAHLHSVFSNLWALGFKVTGYSWLG